MTGQSDVRGGLDEEEVPDHLRGVYVVEPYTVRETENRIVRREGLLERKYAKGEDGEMGRVECGIRLIACPACGIRFGQIDKTAHIGSHRPEDFGLSPLKATVDSKGRLVAADGGGAD